MTSGHLRNYTTLTDATPGTLWLLGRLLADPPGFGVYGAVSLAVRAGWARQAGWVRGR